MNENHVLKLREGATVWREVEGETIVLDLASSSYLGVNDAGTLLWAALTEGADRETLVRILADRYDIDRGQVAADVDAFIADCRRRDLLEP